MKGLKAWLGVLFGFFLVPVSVSAGDLEMFAGFGHKMVSWEALSGRTSAIEMESNGHREVDITLAAGDNMMVGALIDFNEEEQESRRLAVQLGFGDWGFYMDKGKISGEFSTDSDLTFDPDPGAFAYDYTYYGLYGGGGLYGVGYAEWTMPTRATVNYNTWDEVEFVDPETEIKTLGFFMYHNPMRDVIRYQKSGIELSTSLLIGLTELTPSESQVSRIKKETGTAPSVDSYSGIGGINTFRLGYYMGKSLGGEGRGWGFGVGYELRQYGFILPFEDSVTDTNKIFPEYFSISHGPFVMVAATW